MKTRISKKNKIIFAVVTVVLFILVLSYYTFMIYSVITREQFANQAIQISDNNQKSVFKIKKVLLYSSADAIDYSAEKNLKDLSISQFSDLAIYIDNKSTVTELTQENTIKELAITNINITNDSNVGTQYLMYKNPMSFATLTTSENKESRNDINYNIIYDNQENSDYTNPTFFTDCSDPITLSYVNEDIVTHYPLPDNSNTKFNGELLKLANVNLDDLNSHLTFTIKITNNLGTVYTYNIAIDISLNSDNGGIYNGYLFQGKEATSSDYNFFRE